jgi:putative transposase
MQYIKGKSSRKLMMEFKHIQKQYWGRHFWARGYFVASSGNVTDEAIAEYIRCQDGTEPSDGDDKFQVTPPEMFQPEVGLFGSVTSGALGFGKG